METTKEAFKTKMEAQLKIWSARLDGLKAKADKATAEAKIELLKQADEFKAFEASAQKHIADVGAFAADSWHKVQGGVEQTWTQLSASAEAVWAKISPNSPSKS